MPGGVRRLTNMTWVRRAAAVAGSVAMALVVPACGTKGTSDSGSSSGPITLYTCVSDTTIGPVIKAYEKAHPDDKVKLFRAPTGELNARVAGDVRSGGLRADVIWACDPLTMQNYVKQHLVGGWTPKTSIPSAYRTDDYVGVAMLYMVAVTGKGRSAAEGVDGSARIGVPARDRRPGPRGGRLGTRCAGLLLGQP